MAIQRRYRVDRVHAGAGRSAGAGPDRGITILGMLIAEELLLMCLDPESGRTAVRRSRLSPALGGALLVDLVLMERISLTPDEMGRRQRRRVQLISTVPTDDSELDFIVAHLQTWVDIKVSHLVRDVSGKRIVERLGDRLAAAGILSEGPLTRFGTRTWPTDDPRPAQVIRDRVHAAMVGGPQPTERTVALVCLLDSLHRLPDVVRASDPHADPRIVRERARQLSDGDWASQAVKDAIKETAAGLIFTGGPW